MRLKEHTESQCGFVVAAEAVRLGFAKGQL